MHDHIKGVVTASLLVLEQLLKLNLVIHFVPDLFDESFFIVDYVVMSLPDIELKLRGIKQKQGRVPGSALLGISLWLLHVEVNDLVVHFDGDHELSRQAQSWLDALILLSYRYTLLYFHILQL